MDRVILIRIGELYLKGKNRAFFENCLIENIKAKLSGMNCKLYFGRNRYIISDFPDSEQSIIISTLQTVFGINSLSVGIKANSTYESILETVLNGIKNKTGTFRVNVNRADKKFKFNSVELAAELGHDILNHCSELAVDLHNPQITINVDIREDGNSYVFYDKIIGAGGMPVGTAGKGLLLLSGGIDSPVAGYMMAKRGLYIEALNFHSYPYTSEMAKEKVIKLAHALKVYCKEIKLHFISFTKLQEAINKYCDNSYLITILRRYMMRAAESLALSNGCGCIINGESLGQVASQTLQSINATNSVVKTLPVFRPLIGMDKQEIIDISQKISVYDISILPYEDCCTVFMPQKPVIRPQIERCLIEESKIIDAEELFKQALLSIETIRI